MAFLPFYRQHDTMDCGPTCLRMVAKYYGKEYSLQKLRDDCHLTKQGVSLYALSDAAEKIGFKTLSASIPFDKLIEEAPFPCIAVWNQNHYVVIYKTKRGKIIVGDPGHTKIIKYDKQDFLKSWVYDSAADKNSGIVLLLQPTSLFYQSSEDKKGLSSKGFQFLYHYLTPHKKAITQLFVGLFMGSIIQLIVPFLTQSVVDVGINYRDLNFIYLLLAAQVMLFVGTTIISFIRSWIMLQMSTRININLISDFLIKLMKLPISYFDSKQLGDLLQRIGDHSRIENFLTNSTLNIIFSIFNLFLFGGILLYYSLPIFIVFFIGNIFYAIWLILFLKKRRDLDFKRFNRLRDNQDNLIQLITGMQEIKLHNCERQKRWEWERKQVQLFRISVSGLKLDQVQSIGAGFIDQAKNIAISFISAKAVIDGHMTFGMMLSVQYIVGALNSPISQMLGFIHTMQDAKISLERLAEIHNKEDEIKAEDNRIQLLPSDRSIKLTDLKFSYSGFQDELVLNNINLKIPEGKITAIVGSSGSGKTTLLKLLLGFYPPLSGNIQVGEYNLENIDIPTWRGVSGVVMQEGFIFSDTIAGNIGLGDEIIDQEKLMKAVEVANIREFIEGLPMGFKTKIGSDGHGLSAGQRQRILIARAVYKNPEYIYFDEATNALDANNEMIIMNNLNEFFKGRTVVIVAHRLSTVKNADQIIVLEKGEIVERGTHAELSNIKGFYYNLVKNQLELGS